MSDLPTLRRPDARLALLAAGLLPLGCAGGRGLPASVLEPEASPPISPSGLVVEKDGEALETCRASDFGSMRRAPTSRESAVAAMRSGSAKRWTMRAWKPAL